jgi:hypothetical protein
LRYSDYMMSYAFRILRDSQSEFERNVSRAQELMPKYISRIQDFASYTRKEPAKGGVQGFDYAATAEAQLEKRKAQVTYLFRGEAAKFKESIVYDSDDEYDLNSTQKDSDVDLRDGRTNYWDTVRYKKNVMGILFIDRYKPDGKTVPEIIVNSDDRVAPAKTATVEYKYFIET